MFSSERVHAKGGAAGGRRDRVPSKIGGMRRAMNRLVRHRLYIAVILGLAVVFFVRSCRQVAKDFSPLSGRVAEYGDSACEWREGGPQLYVLSPNKKHPDGERASPSSPCESDGHGPAPALGQPCGPHRMSRPNSRGSGAYHAPLPRSYVSNPFL